jgi:hypothetical protein
MELALKEWMKCAFAKESLKMLVDENIRNKTLKADAMKNIDNPEKILHSIGFGLMLKKIDQDRMNV